MNKANNTPSPYLDDHSLNYIKQQVNQLLKEGYCSIVEGEDYRLEAGSSAVNGLIGEHITADVSLYAAIEKRDWQQTINIYEQVFRPYLYEHAIKTVTTALKNKLTNTLI